MDFGVPVMQHAFFCNLYNSLTAKFTVAGLRAGHGEIFGNCWR
jgi:hypothetical protein